MRDAENMQIKNTPLRSKPRPTDTDKSEKIMFDWFLLRFHGMIDWLMVISFVFFLVFTCQFMINFLSTDYETDNSDKDEDRPPSP